MDRGTRDLDLFGPVDQEKKYLDSLNGRLADVVEFNGQCGSGNRPGQTTEIVVKKVREEAERQSVEAAERIKVLEWELTEKNSKFETIMRERDEFRLRWERCTRTSEELRQEIRTWHEKYEDVFTKMRQITVDFEEEKVINQRLRQQIEEITVRQDTIRKEKIEAEKSWRIEKERYERTITEIKVTVTNPRNACDPRVWQRELRRTLEEMRCDFETKLEEYKTKFAQLKQQEVNTKVRELEIELQKLREECNAAKGDVRRMTETILTLESEKVTLLRRIEEVKSTGDTEIENLRRDIERLKAELRETRTQNKTIIDQFGSALDRRVHIQAGLQKYDSLVKVEERRIEQLGSVIGAGPTRQGAIGIEEVMLENERYSESSEHGYDYRYGRVTEE